MKKTIFGKTYFSIGRAATFTGRSRMTMYRWAITGKTSSGEVLDVVHDKVKKQYYVSEASLRSLAIQHQQFAAMAEVDRYEPVNVGSLVRKTA